MNRSMKKQLVTEVTSPACRYRRFGFRWRRGLGLVELLVCLVITASLLTAVGVAFNASFTAYQVNQEQASITQQARLTLNRMLGTIRVTQQHAPATPALSTQFAAGLTVTDTGISMFGTNNALITYQYDSANKQLKVTDNGKTYILLDGVQIFSVTLQPMQSPASQKTGGPYDLLQRAVLLLTVRTTAQTAAGSETTGLQTLTFSSSVIPRRNVW